MLQGTRITYDFEGAAGLEKRELPFVIGVLTDLSSEPSRPFSERHFADGASQRSPPGLNYLRSRAGAAPNVRIRVLDASKADLARDLERAGSFDQSFLFKRVHDDVYGSHGEAPFAVLIGDYEFSHEARDLDLLERIAQVAAAIHAPFLTGVGPAMFGCRTFSELPPPRALPELFKTETYLRLRTFQRTEEAKYVALVLPRFRLPGAENLWASAAWVLAVRMAESFRQYGTCVAIRGLESGGLEPDLPTHATDADSTFTDLHESILAQLGFAFLCSLRGGGAAFFGVPTAALPGRVDSPAAMSYARMHCQLPFVMGAARFMHYAKVIMRDHLGPARSRSDWERILNEWLQQYVRGELSNVSDWPTYPLHEGRIDVREDSSTPGLFSVVGFLSPRSLLEYATAIRVFFRLAR